MDSAGRARIYLSGASYKLVLSTAAGTQIWSVDQVAGSSNSLLASNNTWTGVNTFQATTNFNGPANFNVGLTSLGPNVLNGGGTIAGTYSGSPTLTGIWNFQAELDAVNIVYSGQLFSSIVTGTPPMVITSTTQVPNLNVSLLEGCTWESPCPIGGTTPNTAHFTAIVDTGLFTLGGSNVSSIKGTDPALYTAGTIAGGAGHSLCTDANGSATTSGCSSGFTQIESARIASPCTPPSSNQYDACPSTVTWPNAFADTSYNVTCSAFGTGYNTGTPGNNNANFIYIGGKSVGSATIIVQNGRGAADVPTEIECIAIHP